MNFLNPALAIFGAAAVSIPIIASGGLKNVADITALKNRPGTPIEGAILGRAVDVLEEKLRQPPPREAAALAAARQERGRARTLSAGPRPAPVPHHT